MSEAFHAAPGIDTTLPTDLVRLLDAIPAMVAYVDRKGVYRYANRPFLSTYAERPTDIIGQSFRVLCGDLYPKLAPHATAALQGSAREFEVVGNAAATHGRWLRATYIPDVREGKRVHGFFAIVQDIHDGKTAAIEHRRLQHACDQGMEGFALYDPSGRISYINPAHASMYGYTTTELLGQTWRIFYTEEVAWKIEEVHMPELMKRGHWRGELQGLRKSGETFDAEVSLTLLYEDDRTPLGFVCNCRDITERKVAEESLRQLQRIDALGQLTGGIAHDFNNLLTVILGNLEYIRSSIAQESTEGDALVGAMNAATSAAMLTGRLLSFSRKRRLQEEVVGIRALVNGMEDILSRSLGGQFDLRIVHRGEALRCKADRSQLENAVLNLVLNARDAMSEGGEVTIQTGNLVNGIGDPKLREKHDGDWVVLSVTDTGAGMSSAVRQRMFDPFFTTKPSGKGTGLGLSMVHGFVTQSGGHVEVESEPGQGTCVSIFLPRTNQPLVPDAPERTACPSGDGRRVLVIEDRADVLRIVSRMLASLGYQVLEATDSPSAIRAARESQEPIDLVLSDVRLPGEMNGVELVQVIQALHPDAGPLLMSGYLEEAEADTDIPLLPKPFTLEVLAQAAWGALREQSS